MKIPYKLTAAVGVAQRRAQMASAIAMANRKGWPRLERRTIDPAQALSIAAYGPSLRETWRDLKPPIMSMSGATKFLADRGVIPTWHCDMDPRAHKAMTSLPVVPGVTYLAASVCPPNYFEALGDAPVILWHTVSSNWEDELQWVATHDPGQLVLSGGTTIGLACLQLGGVLGFNRFEIHGMDASFVEGQRHAGPHAGKAYKADVTWAAGGVTYHTIPMMASAAAETVNTFQGQPIIGVFHGRGLTQALIREANFPNACCADETEKRSRLARLAPQVVDVPPIPKGRGTVWDGFLTLLQPEDLPSLVGHLAVCEPRRAQAQYNTGTVPFETSVLLRALCRFYQPSVIAEIGTFIGTSALAMQASRVIYTCDRSNDCVPSTDAILTHPYRSSTEMLRDIQEPVDLFFFDGRIQPEDLPEIARLSHPGTVYAFDDYNDNAKGVTNVERMKPQAPDHFFVPPTFDGRSTLAALLPRQVAA